MKYLTSAYVFLVLGLISGFCAVVEAAPIRYAGEMVATSAANGMDVGDRFGFSFTFDADDAQYAGSGPGVLSYSHTISNELYWSEGDWDFSLLNPARVHVFQNSYGYSGYRLSMSFPLSGVLIGINLPVFTSNLELPVRLPELWETDSAFYGNLNSSKYGGFSLKSENSVFTWGSFDLVRFEEVPSPAAFSLLLVGLTAMGFVRRKNNA